MKSFLRVILPGVAFALTPLVAGAAVESAAAPAKPIRHLSYTFTYNVTTDRTQHDSGIGGPASGMADSKGAVQDRGTIDVDVMQATADLGLLVSISEKAHETRSAEPVKCAVYGNTNFLCDAGKKVNDEEIAVLRLIGRNFVDPDQIDEKNHWRVANDDGHGSSRTSDFTIESNDDNMLKITEQRVEKAAGASGFTITTDGKIGYDLGHDVPTSIDEDSTMRQNIGMGDYETDQTQITISLASDSMTAK